VSKEQESKNHHTLAEQQSIVYSVLRPLSQPTNPMVMLLRQSAGKVGYFRDARNQEAQLGICVLEMAAHSNVF
jgi:hypothetical protein